MPFIRVTRDKRGYESTLVMHAYRPNGGGQRGRVLYFFRTPSNLQIGRRALDAEVMEALEHTHPDLSFDWTTLLRDPALRSGGALETESRRPRERRPQTPRQTSATPVAPTVVVVEDHSVLGEAVGAERAARFRALYAELLQRIARRARTPEERDRLTERATRLNPDSWADAAAVRAVAGTVEQEWQSIAAELPRRRRGRRGGRHAQNARGRADGPGTPADAAESAREAPAGPSGIIDESGPAEGRHDHAVADFDGVGDEDGDRGDRGDDDRVGPEPDGVDAEAAGLTETGDASESGAGDGFSDDD